jgi:glycosyltransferase 2 family protein
MMSPQQKKIAIFLLKIIVSVTLLTWLFLNINFNLFLENVAHLRISFALIAVFFVFIGAYISALRWKAALLYVGLPITTQDSLLLYMAASFLNNFLPTTIGGDGYKYFSLSKIFSVHKNEILFSIFADRASGFGVLFFINTLLSVVFFKIIHQNEAFFTIELILNSLFLLLVIIFLFGYPLVLKLKELFKYKIFNKVLDFFRLNALTRGKLAMQLFLYSVLFVAASSLVQFFLFEALGISTNLGFVILANSIISIAGILPISLNAIGVSEGLGVFLYGLVDVNSGITLAVFLTSRLISLLFSLIAYVVYVHGDYKIGTPKVLPTK